MSSYFSKPTSLARFVLARASDINERVDAVEAAFDLVEADVSTKLGAVDAMGGSIPNAAARANKVLFFDALGVPDVGAYLSEADVLAAQAAASAAASSASSASGSASAASGSAASASASASAASTSASNAQTARLAAETAETNAETAAILAQAWAVNPEDDDVAGYPGQFSAMHHAAKAADSASSASGSASIATTQAGNASTSASSASSSASAASDSAALAQEWATNPEDDDVTGYVGQFSARHHAIKAAASAAAAATFNPANYVEIAGDTMTGTLTVPDIVVTGTATAKRYGTAEYDAGNSGTSKTIDFANCQNQKLTMTGNLGASSITLSNPQAGMTSKIKVIQGSGPYTIASNAWPASVKWADGVAPVLSTTNGAIDIITLYYDGTNYFGQIAKGFA